MKGSDCTEVKTRCSQIHTNIEMYEIKIKHFSFTQTLEDLTYPKVFFRKGYVKGHLTHYIYNAHTHTNTVISVTWQEPS